ncbi:MAG: hypothetical protein U5K74_13380 [Gemmatimonadaceae bacterium]|nr:hypothetical protein [Gemmatimonadaceae bacterium]
MVASVPSVRQPSLLRAVVLGVGLVALTVAGIRLTDRADARRAVRQSLADGAHFGDSLSAQARAMPFTRVPFPSAVALSYLARLELGLGSPFRLVDLARTDPRLPAAWRPRVAHAILSRISRSAGAMEPLSGALDIAMPGQPAMARALLRLVDSVMTLEGDSPLALDAIRIAAAQASAQGLLRPGAVPLIDAAALLAFDRVRARRDVERAITAASRGDGDLLQVVALGRTERRFAVERPLMAEVAPSARRIASRVPMMLAAIERELRDTSGAKVVADRVYSPLPLNAANALSLLISVRTRPAQPQVRLSVLDARVVAANREQAALPRVTRMLLGASNEETLAMAVAKAAPDTVLAPIAAAATLLATQGMRTLAQEAAYHPGVLTLKPEQVALRLGLASLTFGDDVPASWRAYYAREFASAVDALRAVFPKASFTGLNVRIGDSVLAGALAVHDPRSRTLTLPLATGFGAIGHELMHDLDWQTARDLAKREGTYATDNAWRGPRRQPIAAPLARLAEFVPVGVTSSAYATEARRPAELLARGADWFLAAALARQGRVNGALTAVQDGWIRGYASAAGPAAFGDHGAALAALFDVMPALAVRSTVAPRSDAEREPDLGTIARAAWFTTMPIADSLAAQRAPSMIPEGGGPSCSPVARLRLAPLRGTAREVASGFVEPRVNRGMRRWALTADTTHLSGEARLLRRGLLGAPVNPAVIDSARAVWVAAAWRALPCLAT